MKVCYNLYNITQIHQDEIKSLAQKNIDGKIHSYLKSLSLDSTQAITIKIEKNKKTKYVGSFIMILDGKQYIYKTTSDGFRIVEDLVNHAFDRFKEMLSHK